jgi:hypothetical protein
LSVDYMITKEQDEDIPFLDPVSGNWSILSFCFGLF